MFISDVNSKLSKDFTCIGICYGIIGQLNFEGSFLILIKESTKVGTLFDQYDIYKIRSVSIIGLQDDRVFNELLECCEHSSRPPIVQDVAKKTTTLSKTFNSLKLAGSSFRQSTQNVAVSAANQVRSRVKRSGSNRESPNDKDKESFFKRFFDEIHRFFGDNESFYYSNSFDLTNRLQNNNFMFDLKFVNRNFFWNYDLLKDFFAQDESPNSLMTFCTLLIQGFVQIEEILFSETELEIDNCFLCLISRRSRFRAGTRYDF